MAIQGAQGFMPQATTSDGVRIAYDDAGKGEPATAASAPVVPLMLYAETLLELRFAT